MGASVRCTSRKAMDRAFPACCYYRLPTVRTGYSFCGFISHEGAHQWWGNIVGWRSYRDQWMSEGFAEYSGILYTSTPTGFQKIVGFGP